MSAEWFYLFPRHLRQFSHDNNEAPTSPQSDELSFLASSYGLPYPMILLWTAILTNLIRKQVGTISNEAKLKSKHLIFSLTFCIHSKIFIKKISLLIFQHKEKNTEIKSNIPNHCISYLMTTMHRQSYEDNSSSNYMINHFKININFDFLNNFILNN